MNMSRPLLTTEQVAERLGVKPATIYAYVSRGLLRSLRNADGKNSLFAKADVDAFEAGRRRTTTPTIQTGITLIKDGDLYYRGRDAVVLAVTEEFEAVASLLWTNELDGTAFPINRDLIGLAEQVTEPLPDTARLTDRLRVTVAAVAAADPMRFDTSPAAVVATGRQLLSTMVHALPTRTTNARSTRTKNPRPARTTNARSARTTDAQPPRTTLPVTPVSLAESLWSRLTAEPPTDASLRALNAALILLADHDIAASTLAARVAASTRAHPYAVVSAGLAALDGPLHGAASALAYSLLAKSGEDPLAAVSDRLRTAGSSGTIPGFGHHLYPGGDPRAIALFKLLDGPVLESAERLASIVRTRSGVEPNIDLALAALSLSCGMPADAGEAIFAVARTAGWLAHALEEYEDRPLRYRPSGRYAGETPT
ncbi:citrate synthase [Actinoplanes lutulentus]|uniref:citrate synthase (unknown stereospecificity) n=2 Tax=Actinoplanes lutulentus TaxID=1287878 RepID=A0A327Z0X0_9ACTN|nr:citrate synthase [Actinoplanes lutulentus]RAK28048.1 citrate synthase [Actinoplanes lutulentus]